MALSNDLVVTLINFAQDISYIYNIAEKKITHCGDGVLAILGYTAQELLEMDDKVIPSLIHPEDYEQYSRKALLKYSNLKNSEHLIHQYRMKHKNGEWRLLLFNEVIHSRKADGTPKQLFGIVSDITESNETEKKLAAVAQRLKLATESAELGVWDWDVVSNAMIWDERMLQLYGLTPETFPGGFEAWLQGLHPEDRAKTVAECEAALSGQKKWDTTFRIIRPNGVVRYVKAYGSVIFDADNRPLRMLGVNQDITERVLGEIESQETKAILRAAMDQSSAGIAIADAPDGNLRYVNDAGLLIRGGTRETIVNSVGIEQYVKAWRLYDLDGKELNPDEIPLVRAIRYGEVNKREFLIRRDHCEDRIVLANAAPIKDQNGEITAGVVVFSDLTEQRNMEKKLLSSQKLEALGVLAGGIAHDLNNLLSGIFGYIDIAKEQSEQNENREIYHNLSRAMSMFHRAKDLSNQLLTFSKGGNPVVKLQSIAPTIKASTQFALSGSNVTAKFNLQENLWPCIVDENQIGQVIDNIVINAKEAMPTGGVLTISARNVSNDCAKQCSPNCEDCVAITFSDTGTGIPLDLLLRVFDPFFTTKKTGSGLGLSTTYSIVKKHGGAIDISSKEGQGTTVTVCLPAKKDHVWQQPSSKQIGDSFKYSGKILLMDDEADLVNLFQMYFQKFGATFVGVLNHNDAIKEFAKARESGLPFDLVVLDLTVPGDIGGKETIKELRKIDSSFVAIVSSGYSDDPVMAEPTKYLFDDSLPKPFSKAGLIAVIERTCRTRRI